MAERRADKYLGDLYVNGMTTGYNVFYKAKALDPIPPVLVLPEVTDTETVAGQTSLRRSGGAVSVQHQRRGAHACSLTIRNWSIRARSSTYWDVLNPKWKGKIVAYDPTLGGSGDAMRFFYHHKGLGPDLIKRILHRDRPGDQHRYASDGRLASGRQICHDDFRADLTNGSRRHAGAGIAGRLVRTRSISRKELMSPRVPAVWR